MVALTAILPNPYRHIESYKLSESKIETLIQSYGNSEFWHGSIQARPSPQHPHKFEIAFGHHRVEAARRASIRELGLVISRRTNADMLRMMADENREEFRADAYVGVETIAAVIEAYGKGEIELPPVNPKTNKAHIYAAASAAAYTVSTVARFLNWTTKHGSDREPQPSRACQLAFAAYQLRESTKEAFASIPSLHRNEKAIETVNMAVRAASNQARKAHFSPAKTRQAEKMAAEHAAKEIIENTGSRARDVAVEIGKSAVKQIEDKKSTTVPTVEVYINRIIIDSQHIYPYSEIVRSCNRLQPYIDDLDVHLRKKLADALQIMVERNARGMTDIIDTLRRGDFNKFQKLLGANQNADAIEFV